MQQAKEIKVNPKQKHVIK